MIVSTRPNLLLNLLRLRRPDTLARVRATRVMAEHVVRCVVDELP